jgi:5'-nucleotidase
MSKKILFIDMDNTLVDFQSGIDKVDPKTREHFETIWEKTANPEWDEVPGIFALMDPLPGAIEAFHKLAEKYDTYILSTAPWGNPTAWSDKLQWVKRHLGKVAYKRLILSHHKNLCQGDYMIDDRPGHRGLDKFTGEVLSFGPDGKFKDWEAVMAYLG